MLNRFKKTIENISVTARVWSVIWIVLIILFTVLFFLSRSMIMGLYDETAALRWDDKGDAFQFSVFFDEEAKMSTDDIKMLSHEYSKALASTGAASLNEENAALPFTMGYMKEGSISLKTEHRNADNIRVYGVGENYFFFHPVKLVSGSYINSQNIHTDCVLLDLNTAYRLFGSVDIVGQNVFVNNQPLVVVGVYEPLDNRVVNAAKGYDTLFNMNVSENGSKDNESAKNLIYMSFDGLGAFGNSKEYITALDFVSTASSENFVSKFLNDKLSNRVNNMKLVCNTSRFSIKKMAEVVCSFGLRSMRIGPVNYPYYENVALAYEEYISLIYLIMAVILAFIVVIFIVYLYKKYSNRKIHLSMIKDKAEQMIEKSRKKVSGQKHKWEHF